MNSPQAQEYSEQPERSAFARSFERAVGRARVFGLIERVWERAAMPVGGVAGLFLTASWLGLWTAASPSLRVAGVAMFAAALVAAVRPVFGIRMPGRAEALERLNETAGRPGRLASVYDSIPVAGSSEQARALYDLQRRRIEDKVGRFDAGLPQSRLLYRDPYAVRFAMVLATIVSGWVAYADDRFFSAPASAFDWRAESLARPPVKLDAWVTAPAYTGAQPLYIASVRSIEAHRAVADFTVPQNSVLTLRVHDAHTTVSAGGATAPVAESCRPRGAVTECEFRFSGDASITLHTLRDGDLVWNFKIVADRPPQVNSAPLTAENPGASAPQPGVAYQLVDEYPGAEVTGGRIRVPVPGGTGSRPLPHFSLPAITVPVR